MGRRINVICCTCTFIESHWHYWCLVFSLIWEIIRAMSWNKLTFPSEMTNKIWLVFGETAPYFWKLQKINETHPTVRRFLNTRLIVTHMVFVKHLGSLKDSNESHLSISYVRSIILCHTLYINVSANMCIRNQWSKLLHGQDVFFYCAFNIHMQGVQRYTSILTIWQHTIQLKTELCIPNS